MPLLFFGPPNSLLSLPQVDSGQRHAVHKGSYRNKGIASASAMLRRCLVSR
jgi:hypothetical protein